eukprot:NODE_5092_length_603_cov_27.931408_g4397_i0.p4 GENE.NODE_5092_length_603_cov_27.931408_g4397_i0~~NODE_5092_length_603_cov_27.931408_g4397_i0.p4  ORF type:complete len:61 (+),score=3.86 NODE_5092_length_603_cov_27.931408_g4397_i0:144-326(+)
MVGNTGKASCPGSKGNDSWCGATWGSWGSQSAGSKETVGTAEGDLLLPPITGEATSFPPL